MDTQQVDPKRQARRCSFLLAVVLLIFLGTSAIGCFTLAYHAPRSDTPTAVVRSETLAWFDVFHADAGCPGASKMIWNSEYLGTIDVRRPSESFEIPANGYVRLVYRAMKSISLAEELHFRGGFVIKPSPGSEYIVDVSDSRPAVVRGQSIRRSHSRSIHIYAEEEDRFMVNCDGLDPVAVTPVKNGSDKEPPTL